MPPIHGLPVPRKFNHHTLLGKKMKSSPHRNGSTDSGGYFPTATSAPSVHLEARYLPVVRLALEILIDRLQAKGNVVGEQQQGTLLALLRVYLRVALGLTDKRIAFPMPTGGGKTTSVIAFAVALHRLGVKDLSLTIAASKVEALCDIVREMEEIGGTEIRSKVGLIHGYVHDPDRAGQPGFASLPATSDNEGRQFLLVTHNRVKGGQTSLDLYRSFNGTPRSLLVWDESLVASDVTAFGARKVLADMVHLGQMVDRTQRTEGMFQWLTDARQVIEDGLSVDSDQGAVLTLPAVDQADLRAYWGTIPADPIYHSIRKLLEMAGETVRIHPYRHGGVISYEVTIPREVSRVVVLDASYLIRDLCRADTSIIPVWKLPEFEHMEQDLQPGKMKRYSRMQIRHMVAKGGRAATTDSFEQPRADQRKLARDVVKLITTLPADECALVFVYKPREGRKSVREVLLRDLREAGVDPDALVQTKDDGLQPRVSVLTWGMETSLNRYSHVQHVILVGVLQYSSEFLIGRYLSAVDDIRAKFPTGRMAGFIASETAHLAYQAASRGACRRTDAAGEALPMSLYFVHPKLDVRNILEEVFPGAEWMPWYGDYAPEEDTVAQSIAHRIASFLADFDGDTISTNQLKKALGMEAPNVAEMTFTRARRLVEDIAPPWHLSGRSLTRIGDRFGFSIEDDTA